MNTNITFRVDPDVKEEMSAICKELGMTTSTAFNIFANAFVRAKGMPFQVSIQDSAPSKRLPNEVIMADTDSLLKEYASDYKRMAE